MSLSNYVNYPIISDINEGSECSETSMPLVGQAKLEPDPEAAEQTHTVSNSAGSKTKL